MDKNKLQPEQLKKLGGKLKNEKMKGGYSTAKKTRRYKPKHFQADRGKLRGRPRKKTKETGGTCKDSEEDRSIGRSSPHSPKEDGNLKTE